MSDSDPASAQNNSKLSGYAVGVNQTGYDDTLRLWKVKDGVYSTVINTGINWQTGIGITDPVKISVERSMEGKWILNVFRMNNSLIGTSSGKDAELFRHEWFIISYRYTSTRDRLLWLDDIIIEGVFQEDHEPPEITGCEVTGRKSLLISFNEEVSDGSLMPSNFASDQPGNKVIKLVRKTSHSINVEFEEPFLNKSKNKLIINNLCDRLLNCKTGCEYEFIPVHADPGDIIISEIMADPYPVVSLPAKEYIEIFNTTMYPFNTMNWSLSDGNTNCTFPEKTILPGDYIILCQLQDTSLFNSFGRTAGLKSFPALTDGGKILTICDSTSNLMDGIEYSSEWYGDELKADGGWSLEIIDTGYPFSQEGNWHASLSKAGGTPGKANSVTGKNPDRIFSGIENVFPPDSITIILSFSESVLETNKIIRNIETGGPEPDTLFASDPLMRDYILNLREPLHEGRIYTLRIGDEVTDFAGNGMQRNEFSFGIPEPVQKRDILFNELLFNPLPAEPDYIEFYNRSEQNH